MYPDTVFQKGSFISSLTLLFKSRSSYKSEIEDLVYKARADIVEAFRILDDHRLYFPSDELDRHAENCADILKETTNLKVQMEKRNKFSKKTKEMKIHFQNAKHWETRSFAKLAAIRTASWAAKTEYMVKASATPKQETSTGSLPLAELSELILQIVSSVTQKSLASNKEAPVRTPLAGSHLKRCSTTI